MEPPLVFISKYFLYFTILRILVQSYRPICVSTASSSTRQYLRLFRNIRQYVSKHKGVHLRHRKVQRSCKITMEDETNSSYYSMSDNLSLKICYTCHKKSHTKYSCKRHPVRDILKEEGIDVNR